MAHFRDVALCLWKCWEHCSVKGPQKFLLASHRHPLPRPSARCLLPPLCREMDGSEAAGREDWLGLWDPMSWPDHRWRSALSDLVNLQDPSCLFLQCFPSLSVTTHSFISKRVPNFRDILTEFDKQYSPAYILDRRYKNVDSTFVSSRNSYLRF